MKRAEIEKLFDGKLAEGVEVKEIIDAIMKINGDDVNLAKESAAKASNASIEINAIFFILFIKHSY